MSAVPVEKRSTGTRDGALPVNPGVSLSTNGAIERQGLTYCFRTLTRRCMDCGKMSRVKDGLPEEYPNYGEPTEALIYGTGN